MQHVEGRQRLDRATDVDESRLRVARVMEGTGRFYAVSIGCQSSSRLPSQSLIQAKRP
jgi:hypothetical protein